MHIHLLESLWIEWPQTGRCFCADWHLRLRYVKNSAIKSGQKRHDFSDTDTSTCQVVNLSGCSQELNDQSNHWFLAANLNLAMKMKFIISRRFPWNSWKIVKPSKSSGTHKLGNASIILAVEPGDKSTWMNSTDKSVKVNEKRGTHSHTKQETKHDLIWY